MIRNSKFMMTASIPILILLSLRIAVDAMCYPQYLCEDGFMDRMKGTYAEAANCTGDCAGGPYYANMDCACACVREYKCERGQSDEDDSMPTGAIVFIIVAALCGVGVCCVIVWSASVS